MINPKPHPFFAYVVDDDSKYWDWGRANLTTGTWLKTIGLVGTSATYWFKNKEDLLAFKIVFGV